MKRKQDDDYLSEEEQSAPELTFWSIVEHTSAAGEEHVHFEFVNFELTRDLWLVIYSILQQRRFEQIKRVTVC